MKKIFIILCFLGLTISGWSQQDAHYSQYMFNGQVLNPAYSGSHEHVSVRFLNRWQWIGIDGAPRTQSFAVNGASRNLRNGFGFSLHNDNIGVTNNLFLNGDYAFRILINDNARLSLGLRGSLANYKTDFNTIATPGGVIDPSFTGNTLNLWQGNVGTGLFFNNRWMYMGASIPHLIDNPLVLDGSASTAKRSKHYLLNAGVILGVGKAVQFIPSTLVKLVAGAPASIDINANLVFNKKFWIGASYRTQDAWVFLARIQIAQGLQIGYAYDRNFSELASFTSGSHELMLGFDFSFAKKAMVNPRYF